jgi:hypothetical protein
MNTYQKALAERLHLQGSQTQGGPPSPKPGSACTAVRTFPTWMGSSLNWVFKLRLLSRGAVLISNLK